MNFKLGIIGLGYVGLPLSLAFAAKYKVIGYDINPERVNTLKRGIDTTNEVVREQIQAVSNNLIFTESLQALAACNVYIVTVPTPIDNAFQPDLSFLEQASKQVASILKKGDIVVYESTVYPGCTEEVCVPILEQCSNLKYNIDFFVGYSPERINPGDKTRPIHTILKVTSGSNIMAASSINELYRSVIEAGTYLAPSIKVAEAAKAIENAQRDVNISFMNELALIFDRLGIDTMEVLKAAGTKWNFLPFKPGLVGGHCIGVDPHYLAYKAIAVGYHPQVILSGRKVNEQMGVFVGEKLINLLVKKYAGNINQRRVLILGFAFKENCADIRNTKVMDIYSTLTDAGLQVEIYDPLVNMNMVEKEHNITIIRDLNYAYDAVILAVAHEEFEQINYAAFKKNGAIIYDTKGVIDLQWIDGRL